MQDLHCVGVRRRRGNRGGALSSLAIQPVTVRLAPEEELGDALQEVVRVKLDLVVSGEDHLAQLIFKRLFVIDLKVGPFLDWQEQGKA